MHNPTNPKPKTQPKTLSKFTTFKTSKSKTMVKSKHLQENQNEGRSHIHHNIRTKQNKKNQNSEYLDREGAGDEHPTAEDSS